MSDWKPVPLVGGSDPDDATPFASQKYINLLPTAPGMSGGRSDWMLRGVPGLVEFGTVGTRHRGARDVEGRLFVVSGEGLYQMAENGTGAKLMDIPGSGRVSMSHNQIASGNELFIATSGGSFVWNTVTLTGTRVTDSGFPGWIQVDFINQLFVGLEIYRRFFSNSALGDGLDHNALERYQAEASPDRLRSIIVSNGELWAFGERTTEVFANTGRTNALFENKKIPIEVGCDATHSVAKLDKGIAWLGNGAVWLARGYDPVKISTPAIEQKIARCDREKAFAFVWRDRGYEVYYLTFPDGETWGYDCAASAALGRPVWHTRASGDVDNRWRLATLVEWNGDWYGGEYNSGRLFRLDWDYCKEGDDELIAEWVTPVLHNGGNPVQLNALKLEWDTGGPASVYVAGAGLTIEGDLPDGDVTETVDFDYTATGTGPFTFEVIGTLPTGLSLATDGNVTGTYTTPGSFSWQIEVTDANGLTARLSDRCVVSLLEMEITGTLPDTLDDVDYSERLAIIGGTPPYANATISSGALPTTGTVAIDGDELVIEWDAGQTPDVYEFTVRVEDSVGDSATSAQEVELFQTYEVFVGHVQTAAAAVSLLDPDTNTITGTLAAGSGMRYPALTDDGLALIGMGLSYPTKIVIATGVATTIGAVPSQFTTAIDATHVYSAVFSPPKLYKHRISDGVLIATYTPTIECGGNMGWNADRTKLYLSRYGGYGFTVLNVAAGTLTNYATSGHDNNQGRGIVVRASDERVFKTGQNHISHDGRLTQYTATGTVVGYYDTTDELQNPAIHPNGTQLWAPNYDNTSGKVYVFDITGATPALVATITVGSKPNALSFSPDGLVVYCTNGTGDSVSVIDTATYTVTATVSVNDSPRGVAIKAS